MKSFSIYYISKNTNPFTNSILISVGVNVKPNSENEVTKPAKKVGMSLMVYVLLYRVSQ